MPLLFSFNPPTTTAIYTLSLHDALPILISVAGAAIGLRLGVGLNVSRSAPRGCVRPGQRSEEHTSELQSPVHLVCRLLLEKKKNRTLPASTARIGLCRRSCGRRRPHPQA